MDVGMDTEDDKAKLVELQDQIFKSLAAAEMFKAESGPPRTSPMRRGHVTEKMWPSSDPVLQRLLSWWASKQCVLTANHDARLACVRRFLAFQAAPAIDESSSRLKDANDLAATVSDRTKVSQYCEFLEKAGLAAETIKKRLLALRHVVAWHRTMVLRPEDSGEDAYNLAYTRSKQTEEYFSILILGYQRQHGHTKQDRSIGSLVQAQLWPGDEEVRNIIGLNIAEYCTKLAEAKLHKTVSKHDYTWVLSFILNAITIHGLSARPGFFAKLTIGIAAQAAEAGLCASTSFKTAKTFLVQAIALDKECRALIEEYLTVWRPLVVATGVVVSDNDILFLNNCGKPVGDISRVVSVLWERTFNRTMCITVLRFWYYARTARMHTHGRAIHTHTHDANYPSHTRARATYQEGYQGGVSCNHSRRKRSYLESRSPQ
jgi:hypothetical protein